MYDTAAIFGDGSSVPWSNYYMNALLHVARFLIVKEWDLGLTWRRTARSSLATTVMTFFVMYNSIKKCSKRLEKVKIGGRAKKAGENRA